MANYTIPRRRTKTIETMFGIDADGNVVVCKIFEHVREGHDQPEFYVLQYREHNRRIDRGTRYTRRFSGPAARERLESELAETRKLLAQSRTDRKASR